jgi:hypothetical protein
MTSAQGNSSVVLRDGQPIELPGKLFKFLTLKYARALCDRGAIRIGTLYEYRNQEHHGHGVLDIGEGTLRHSETVVSATLSQMTGYTQNAAFKGSAPDFKIRNATIVTSIAIQDRFMYCLSLSPSWEAVIDPSYTACVEIFNVVDFLRGIQNFLIRAHLVTSQVGCGAVVYAGRDHKTFTEGSHQSGGPPAHIALLKPVEYRNQREFRFMFEPTSFPIEPKIGKNPALSKHCRMQSIRPTD